MAGGEGWEQGRSGGEEDARMEDILQTIRDEYWQSLEADREVKARDLLRFVSFSVSGQVYALSIGEVKEVTLMPGISRLPRSPEHLVGVMNLRGRIVPLLDLRPLLGVPDREIRKEHRVIIVASEGREVGLVAEEIHGILEVEPADLHLRSETDRAEEDPFVAGQLEGSDGLTIVLDGKKLIEAEARRIRE